MAGRTRSSITLRSRKLCENDRVMFDVGVGKKGPCANNVRLADGATLAGLPAYLNGGIWGIIRQQSALAPYLRLVLVGVLAMHRDDSKVRGRLLNFRDTDG